MSESKIPHNWETAKLTNFFLKVKRCKTGNYLPVTSRACTILESIIKGLVVDCIHVNYLLNEPQHGFVKHNSACI